MYFVSVHVAKKCINVFSLMVSLFKMCLLIISTRDLSHHQVEVIYTIWPSKWKQVSQILPCKIVSIMNSKNKVIKLEEGKD